MGSSTSMPPRGATAQAITDLSDLLTVSQATELGRVPADCHPMLATYFKAAFLQDRPAVKQQPYKWIQHYGNKSRFASKNGDPLKFPYDITTDKAGNVYVADQDRHRVQVYKPDGTWIRAIGVQGTADGQLMNPSAVVIDFEGRIMVLEQTNARVSVFSNTKFLFRFGQPGKADGEMSGPRGMALSNEGEIVVSDFDNNRIQVFSPKGVFIKKFGQEGTEVGKLRMPVGVAVDYQGNYYVVEHLNHRVQIFDPDGTSIRIIGDVSKDIFLMSVGSSVAGQFASPWGIVLDRDQNMLITDNSNHRIQVFSPQGEFLVAFGSDGANKLNYPRGLALTKNGNILVVDNHKICVWG